MADNKVNEDIEQMRVIYKDIYDKVQEALIKLPEEESGLVKSSYKERVDMAISDIMDEGGFWLNHTDAIPFHRILSFHTFTKKITKYSKSKTNKNRSNPRRRKRNINESTVSGGDKVPQPSSNSDK